MGVDLLAQPTLAAMLLAWWNTLLVIALVGVWAWIVSTIYDKDAARFYLPRERWNAIHITAAIVAVGVALFVPLTFWITLPLAAVILFADLAAYFVSRNKDERVPDSVRWSSNPADWFKSAARAKSTPKKERSVKGITMSLAGPNGRAPTPEPETAEYNVRVAAEEVLGEVVMRRASKAKIGPVKEGVYAAVLVVDGVNVPIKQFSANDAAALMDYLKRTADLNVEERRKKQRGALNFGFGEQANTEAQITTQGSSRGMQLTLLVNPAGQVDFKAKDLGFLEKQERPLQEIVSTSGGIVLLAAPPGHGRTALLYAMVREHDAYTSNIQILEYETQRSIEGVRHNIFDPQEGGEYATVARSILRRDPDVVGIADVPDADTAHVIARADTEQSRVYLGMTEGDPVLAVRSWVKAVGDGEQAAEPLRGVIACRLLRRLCENCRFASKPAPEVLEKLKLPKNVQALYRTEGKVMVKDRPETCPVCGGTGYYGQVAAFAVHPIRADDRRHIAAGDEQSLRGAWRQRDEPSIQTAALQLLVEGKTSVDELVRVLQGGGKKSSGSSKQKQAAAKPAAAGAES